MSGTRITTPYSMVRENDPRLRHPFRLEGEGVRDIPPGEWRYEVERLMDEAAMLWRTRYPQFGNSGRYSTCENLFLYLAEGAWFAADEVLRPPPPPSIPDRPNTGAKVVIPPTLRWAVWERDDFRCQHCGSRQDLAVDHILAESKGGTLDMVNLQTLCRPCNSRKGVR